MTRFTVLQSTVSAVSTTIVLVVCVWLPHIDHATVALLLVAAIVGFATLWGRVPALTCGIVGGLGFDYYFLPPRGFGVDRPEHIVAFAAFLLIAAVMGQLAARMAQLLTQRDSLLRLSLDPLCIADLNGNFQSVNQAMVELLGWSETELRSGSFFQFIHPQDLELTRSAFLDVSGGHPVVDIENRCRTKSGDWLWLHWKIAPPTPGTSWISAAAHDVTEEKWSREKLHNLAGQVMSAQEEERRRIARELHDDVTQRLATLGIELGLLKRTPAGADSPELQGELSRLQTLILGLSEDVRNLSHSLHPGILEHSTLVASLEALCREFSASHGIETAFSTRNRPENIPRPIALALYRVAQESLRNVASHSGAAEASVVLAGEKNTLSLYIIDSGRGFDVHKSKISPGLGLVSVEERVRQIGGTVIIESTPNAGTRITVHVPLVQTKAIA